MLHRVKTRKEETKAYCFDIRNMNLCYGFCLLPLSSRIPHSPCFPPISLSTLSHSSLLASHPLLHLKMLG